MQCRTSTSTRSSGAGSSRSSVRRGRRRPSPSAARCAAASRSSVQPVRGRSSKVDSYVVPGDVERLFGAVLEHRIVFTPRFLAARARQDGRRPSLLSRRNASKRSAARVRRVSAVVTADRSGRACGQLSADVRSRSARRLVGLAFGAMHSARRGNGIRHRRLASVSPRGRRGHHRLGGVREALGRAWPGRVHRSRASRGGGPVRRVRLRPAARDGAHGAAAPMAPEARRDARRDRT